MCLKVVDNVFFVVLIYVKLNFENKKKLKKNKKQS